jgi:hypothetical protein
MLNKKRIIIMTKLAIYDQKFGIKDKKSNEYYRHDYIYRKNMWTRLSASLGAVFIIIIYWIYQLFVVKVNYLDIDYKKAGINAAVFILVTMAVYTVIGTILEARQYSIGQKRLKAYMRMLALLDRMRGNAPDKYKEEPKEESNLYYGADIAGKRNDNSLI